MKKIILFMAILAIATTCYAGTPLWAIFAFSPLAYAAETNEITLFTCPDSPVCSEAKKCLESICQKNNATLVVRECKNENTIKKIISNTTTVPLIIVNNTSTKAMYKYEGWDTTIETQLVAVLGETKTNILGN